jgi:polysaccharide pyruvyl transferase CsaB
LRIGISGSYGGMNLGDEAILEGILGQLRATVAAEVTVFSKNPEDTLARHRVERAISPRTLTRREMVPEIQRLDVFILGGGGILYDRDAEEYLRELLIASELQVPVLIYAISAGPLLTQASRQAVQSALNSVDAPIVTVRDRLGYRLLEDVGVTQEIHLTADPAFLLQPEELSIDELKAEGVDFDRPLIGFSVREPGPAAPDIQPEEYYALLANAADFMVERYDANVLFVPMEKADVQHSHAVVAHMQNAERGEILRRRYSPGQILDLMGRFELAVGMRLHFLIFATVRGTPFTALPYASKVTGLLDDLNMPMPPLGSVGIGQLIARIDRSWDTRGDIRKKIGDRLPALRDRAQQTNRLLLQLIEDRGPARSAQTERGGERAAAPCAVLDDRGDSSSEGAGAGAFRELHRHTRRTRRPNRL